jgi:hypothetical protein
MPAGIIRNARVRTVLATVDMAAKRGSATYLDRRHHTSLGEAYVAGIGRAPRLTMATKDIRQFEIRPQHVRPSLRPLLSAGRRRATGSAATTGPS